MRYESSVQNPKCAKAPKGEMPSLWSAMLALGLLEYCSCHEDGECVVGLVGEPVSLPCFYSGHALASLNLSVEWRRGHRPLLRAVWLEARLVELWPPEASNTTRLSDGALENGDFSLELSAVMPLEVAQTFHMFLGVRGAEAPSSPLCSVCLRTAASFTAPSVRRLDPPEANQTTFLCHSVGGRPQPTVHWLINGTRVLGEDSVTTSTLPMAHSPLYNTTSRLLAQVSHQTNVTCSVENASLNQTLTGTSYGVKVSPVWSRASAALWVFSAGLSLGVAVLVVAVVIYQVLLDKSHKKLGKTHRGYHYSYSTEEAVVRLEGPDGAHSQEETDG